MKKITGYLASQLGFSETGRYILETLIKPRLLSLGLVINDPFLECGKELDFSYLFGLKNYSEVEAYWRDFSRKVTPINNALMRQSDCLLAILDGGHAIDDGVASEIGYFTGIEQGPVFALRSDFRCGENLAVTINPQILGYILLSKGFLADGPKALENWFAVIQQWTIKFAQS